MTVGELKKWLEENTNMYDDGLEVVVEDRRTGIHQSVYPSLQTDDNDEELCVVFCVE